MADWRDESGIERTSKYKKRYALFPMVLTNGEKIWLGWYYKKYYLWLSSHVGDEYGHVDFVESISEQEYMLRKLAESL